MRLVVVGAFVTVAAALCAAATPVTASSSVGTWTGTSTCVGNRPACKNEVVVYRVVPVEGHPKEVRLFADKIIEGKRVAMGAFVFEVDESAGTLRAEFQRGNTHGVWLFAVTGDTIKGTLKILPEGNVGRDVSVHRVKEADVPAAPPSSDYDE